MSQTKEENDVNDSLLAESELRQAIQREHFELHYQPKHDAKSGKLTGVEALIRWNHPTRGTVSPGSFIPLAEETGLIVPIGEWVIRQACIQMKKWISEGMKPLPISVNVSVRQLQYDNIALRIRDILQSVSFRPDGLILEITESMTMDVEQAVAVLKEMRQLGLRISLDDFGTGFSSLSVLQRFPLDILKMDKSFIDSISNDSRGVKIVNSMIRLAHELGLTVVAEGVEEDDQVKLLQNMRCDEIQGYLYSPPIRASQFFRYALDHMKINDFPDVQHSLS